MKYHKINYEKLFKKYPMGYERYRDWLIDMCRLRALHPLDCDFLCEAWLLKWQALEQVLRCRAMLIIDGEVQQGRFCVGTALYHGYGAHKLGYSAKVRIWATGDVVKQWSAHVAD